MLCLCCYQILVYIPFLHLFQCLRHFAHLTKHGSVNAKPVYLFMLAVKKPSREAFNTAIDACNEAGMVHLEAIAKERYGTLLKKENDTPLANDYLISSYWLYRDWGAHAKALQLSQEYEFLEVSESDTLCFHALYYIINFLLISWFVRFSSILQGRMPEARL